MAPKPNRNGDGFNLFDIIEVEQAKENPEDCPHTHEEKTFTVWGRPCVKRWTWTCKACGHIRGRVTG